MGPLDKDDAKDERAVGRAVMLAFTGLLSNPKAWAIVAAMLGGSLFMREQSRQSVDAFTAEEMRQIVRIEVDKGVKKGIAPLEAGFKALAKKQTPETRVAIFEAMERAREREN